MERLFLVKIQPQGKPAPSQAELEDRLRRDREMERLILHNLAIARKAIREDLEAMGRLEKAAAPSSEVIPFPPAIEVN